MSNYILTDKTENDQHHFVSLQLLDESSKMPSKNVVSSYARCNLPWDYYCAFLLSFLFIHALIIIHAQVQVQLSDMITKLNFSALRDKLNAWFVSTSPYSELEGE